MDYRENENNKVMLQGKITMPFSLHVTYEDESFYKTELEVERLSGRTDTIKLLVSEKLVNVEEDCTGRFVRVNAQFRSYNQREGNKTHLILHAFVREWYFMDSGKEVSGENEITLKGFLCKSPVYRRTPLGRQITDLLLAVNRAYGKTDYIPCVAWGRNAKVSSGFKVGDQLQVSGRIQGREYDKKTVDGVLRKIAYEVSVSKLNLVE